jgi:type II secretory pathway pseudopilin PulG
MDTVSGTVLVVVLLAALVAVRLVYRSQRQQRQRTRRTAAGGGLGRVSERSDMRAYDDPSTLNDAVARAKRQAPAAPPPQRQSPDSRRKP